MKIVVFSDSHGDVVNMKKILDIIHEKMSMVIHLGDFVRDAQWIHKQYPRLTLRFVAGNCDFQSGVSTQEVIEVANKKILMTHGHLHGVKGSVDNLVIEGEAWEADICLFGHTHAPYMREINKMLVLNPGSISQSRSANKESYAVIDIDDATGVISSNVMELKDGFIQMIDF